jgi:glycerophosphoryl diester phosphodiesterase
MDRVSQGRGARILVHGHRGARARMPENSLAAFHYAIACGVDAIEMDLVLTGDGQIVVAHDPLLEAGTEPRLDDVFRLASMGAFLYDLEIKWRTPTEPHALVEYVLDKIRQWRLEARVSILSFDFRVLRIMRKLAQEIRLAALTDSDPRAFSEIAKEVANAETIVPEFPLVTREKVEAAHAAALQVVPWTVNAPRDWDAMIAAGVDGIITDDPAALIAHLQARGLR